MKLRKCALIMAGAMALLVTLNVNAMAPVVYERTESRQVESPRTTPCQKHEWVYVTTTLGDTVYYNYQCEVCGKLLYSPWKKQ